MIVLLIWLVLMTISFCLAFQVIKAHQNLPQPQRRKQRRRPTQKADLNSPAYAGLWHQLLRLLHFDVATAQRLVSDYKHRNPSRSLKWCLEKAIWDLERDRR
jgi:4-hydroxybenzoate polyprenyltransferase